MNHGIKALTDWPEQRRRWMDDLDGLTATAVEEIIRWATPTIHFRRTATRDVEIAGTKIRAGDKVVMWYLSANRDEDVFSGPFRFDIARTPNPHVGFGGGGIHFCLGASLARLELKVILRELLTRLPDIRLCGEAEMLRSCVIRGIKRMPVEFTPAG
jgi:cytochrome P450